MIIALLFSPLYKLAGRDRAHLVERLTPAHSFLAWLRHDRKLEQTDNTHFF